MGNDLKKQFIEYNNRNNKKQFWEKPFLSKWFEQSLDRAINRGDIVGSVKSQTADIVRGLGEYRIDNNINTVSIGISGGIDSAVTAALFKEAGWRVIGVLMPIKQNPIETHNGLRLVSTLGIDYVLHDLTRMYDQMYEHFSFQIDKTIGIHERPNLVRAGNIRARLRMITLYNIAAQHGGCVGSTDNFSELASGFWTLHGDVGDLAPIQSMTKSWEVPMMARELGVPEEIIEARPTDGLGIDAGDEAQFGFSYAHLDLVLLDSISGDLLTYKNMCSSSDDVDIIKAVEERIRRSAFKRSNPANMPHPISGNWRYQQLAELDRRLISAHKQTYNTPEVK